MAILKSIQTRFVEIRDNHNHYTSLYTLAFLDYYRPIDVDLFKTCYPWSVLDLHVRKKFMFSLSVSF